MTRNEMERLAEFVIANSSADEISVIIKDDNNALTRFAENQITQNVSNSKAQLILEVAFDNKVARVSTERFDSMYLKHVIGRAERFAKQNQENHEYVSILGKQDIKAPENTFFANTAEFSPVQRAEIVKNIVSKAKKVDYTSAGSVSNGFSRYFIANNKGLSCYYEESKGNVSFTIRNNENGSGNVEWEGKNFDNFDLQTELDDAFHIADINKNHIDLEPGAYKVILMPPAVYEFVGWMVWGMNARAADEKRSAFTGKLGKKIASDIVSIYYDPYDKRVPSMPFTNEGLPIKKNYLIKKGVLTNLLYSRYWAKKMNKQPNGMPTNLIFSQGKKSLKTLIKNVDRGVLVRRFWYIRMVDPMKYLLTGMTRDGLFLIENGKITKALNNMRFNESPLNMLANVLELGKATAYGNMLAPIILAADFNFSSKTLF